MLAATEHVNVSTDILSSSSSSSFVLEKRSSIDDRGQTHRVNALPRPHALDSATAAGLGRATPHASQRHRAAEDVAIKTYYYCHQSIIIGRRSRYSFSTHVLFDWKLDCGRIWQFTLRGSTG